MKGTYILKLSCYTLCATSIVQTIHALHHNREGPEHIDLNHHTFSTHIYTINAAQTQARVVDTPVWLLSTYNSLTQLDW